MIARGTHATRDDDDDANANAMTTRVLFLRTDVVRSREKTPWWRRRRSARDWARNPEDATRGVRRRWAAQRGGGWGDVRAWRAMGGLCIAPHSARVGEKGRRVTHRRAMDGWMGWMGVTLGPAGARARTKREEEDCFVLTF